MQECRLSRGSSHSVSFPDCFSLLCIRLSLFGHLDIYNQSLSAFNSGNEIISFFPTEVLLHVWGGGAFTHTW